MLGKGSPTRGGESFHLQVVAAPALQTRFGKGDENDEGGTLNHRQSQTGKDRAEALFCPHTETWLHAPMVAVAPDAAGN